jgi:L-cysteine S-thiosulfotransferase
MKTAAYRSARGGGALLLLTLSVAAAFTNEIPRADRRSGYDLMSRELKSMQDDRTSNPGMLSVLDGEAIWKQRAGAADRACADCHGNNAAAMKGVAVRYPAFDKTSRRPINLEQRINQCREQRQHAPPLVYESKELLALSAFVAGRSRGLKISPPADKRLIPFRNAGREFFYLRQGQLNLSCAQCHDDNWSKRLAGSAITQAHPTGYPLYRLEWQGMGSLQRRLRNCLIGMRAESFDYGTLEYVSLEVYLMWRARGMTFETPAVRP